MPSAENPEGYLYVVLRGETYESIERTYSDSLLLRLSGWTSFMNSATRSAAPTGS